MQCLPYNTNLDLSERSCICNCGTVFCTCCGKNQNFFFVREEVQSSEFMSLNDMKTNDNKWTTICDFPYNDYFELPEDYRDAYTFIMDNNKSSYHIHDKWCKFALFFLKRVIR